MSIVNTIKKTIRYGRKNGFKPAFYTAYERVKQKKELAYVYMPVSEYELDKQRKHILEHQHKISILVPTYETKPVFLNALIQSVLAQTYSGWELILADASASSIVKDTASQYNDERIVYHKLSENGGISVNTNQAMQYATGEYCALLDHDDLLTPDALYEMVVAIDSLEQKGVVPAFLYSDEDKCDTEAKTFFDPHYKLDFNLELLLTNNYICHFLVIKTELLTKTPFRKEYDGAQDFDLVLRLVKAVQAQYASDADWMAHIVHIPKILYHWRCHMDSTADNPESKMYAYEAGKNALQDYYQSCGIRCEVKHAMHLGFYRTVYHNIEEMLSQRAEIGVVGGLLVKQGRITGGAYTMAGAILYKKIHRYFSGYMNRLHLTQNVDAVDVRCMKIDKRWENLYMEIIGVPYRNTLPEASLADRFGIRIKKLSKDNSFLQLSEEEIINRSIAFCKAVRDAGEEIVLDPMYRIQL